MRNTYYTLFFYIFLICYVETLFGQCPKKVINCTNGCGRYIDGNADGYCDYSIVKKDIKKEDSLKSNDADSSNIKAKLIDSKLKSTPDQEKTSTKFTKQASDNTSENILPEINNDFKVNTESLEAASGKQNPSPRNSYHLILFSGIIFFLYFLTHILSKRKIIKKSTHKKIWNTLLLCTFLVSCLFGLFLVIQLNYQVYKGAFDALLYWHVEVGICMTLISVFHILWHWSYFRNLTFIKNNHKSEN